MQAVLLVRVHGEQQQGEAEAVGHGALAGHHHGLGLLAPLLGGQQLRHPLAGQSVLQQRAPLPVPSRESLHLSGRGEWLWRGANTRNEVQSVYYWPQKNGTLATRRPSC